MVLSSLSISDSPPKGITIKVRWGTMEFGDMGRLGVIAESMVFIHTLERSTWLPLTEDLVI